MPSNPEPGILDAQQLRTFAQPAANLRQKIEEVAEYVAEHGPNAEFQLRSGKDGRKRVPFLFLDDKFAPFYQLRLREARLKRNANDGVGTSEAAILANDSSDESEHTVSAAWLTKSPESDPLGLGDLAYLHNYTHNDASNDLSNEDQEHFTRHHLPADHSLKRDRNGRATAGNGLVANADGNHQSSFIDISHPSRQPQSTPLTQKNHTAPSGSSQPGTHSFQAQHNPADQGILPYGLLQEVHLLDSSGTERSGLNTFIVVSNSFDDSADDLLDHLCSSPMPFVGRGPIYRLRPDASVVFRATHQRLLPVGLALGEEVEIINESEEIGAREEGVIGIIVRRTVELGNRLYDVKDVRGLIHKNVSEDVLRLHRGGAFGFRRPN